MSDNVTPPDDRSGFWNANHVHPARTLILCGIGALLGLGIAGYGLFTASGTTTAIYPAEDAAIVNGVPVLMVDLVGQVRALYDVPFDAATKAQKTKALDDMIREELYVQRGVELGLPNDDTDVRTALVGAAEAQTVSEELTTVPPPAALQAYYAAHRDRYASEGAMDVTDWVAPDGGDAGKIVTALRAGGDPTALGLVRSGIADSDEQFYFAARIHLGPALFAVAAAMPSGAVSNPVVVAGKAHILVMKRHTPPVLAAYPQVEARVFQDYTDGVKKRALAENTAFLLGRARITVAPALQ